MARRSSLVVLGNAVVALSLVAASGCLQVLGLDEFHEGNGGSASATGTGSMSTTSTGGPCTAGQTQECYSADAATKDIGNCKHGTQSCVSGQFGTCEGEVTPATEDFYAKGDENCDGVASGDALTAQPHGGDLSEVEGMATDAMGNLFIAGFFAPSINFGPTPQDGLVAVTEQDFFVAKFAPDGTFVWSKRFGDSTNELLIRIAISSTGDIWLAGEYKDTITFGTTVLPNLAPGSNSFVARLDANGDPIAAMTIEHGSVNSGTFPGLLRLVDIATLPGGDAVITGTFDTAVTLGSNSFSASGNSSYVARLRPDMSVAWAHQYGDGNPNSGFVDGDQRAKAVATDLAGNIGVAGVFSGSITTQGHGDENSEGGLDGFLIRLDQAGNETAVAFAGGAGDAILDQLVADASGAFVIGGSFTGALTLRDSTNFPAALMAKGGSADSDLLLWKLTPQGKHAWSRAVGDSMAQFVSPQSQLIPNALAIDPSGEILFVGGAFGAPDFGGTVVTSAGDQDAFVSIWEPDGKVRWAKGFGDGAPAQAGTAATFLDADHVAVGLVNQGTMDLGLGPLAPMPPDTSQLILARFFR